MEYFSVEFKLDGQDMVALIIKQQSPEEIIYYAHVDEDISPLKNPQRFSFVDGAFNETPPDKLKKTLELRQALWHEIYHKEHAILTERSK